jgi:MATE family multidrug resistance protein
VDGYAFATESLCGKFYGKKDFSGLKSLYKLSFNWGLGSGLVFLLVLFLFGKVILSVFTSQESVLDEAIKYMPWLMLACLLNPVAFIIDGIFIGLAKAKEMRKIMIRCSLFIYLPCLFIFWTWNNHGLWLSMSLFMLMRSAYMAYELKQVRVD